MWDGWGLHSGLALSGQFMAGFSRKNVKDGLPASAAASSSAG